MDVSLDVVTITLSGDDVTLNNMPLELVGITINFPASPSLGLIYLDTVSITFNLSNIVGPAQGTVPLGTVSVRAYVAAISATTLSYCEAKNVIKFLRGGGMARATPGTFIDSEIMHVVDHLREGAALPSLSYSTSCYQSSLINALLYGSPVPFEVPALGTWCGEGEPVESAPDPIANNVILYICAGDYSSITKYYTGDKLLSSNFGLDWRRASPDNLPEASIFGVYLRNILFEYLGKGYIFLSAYDPYTTYARYLRLSRYGQDCRVVDLSSLVPTAQEVKCVHIYAEGCALIGTGVTSVYADVVPSAIVETTGYGASHRLVAQFIGYKYLNAVARITDDIILAIKSGISGGSTANAYIMRSTDGGVSWSEVQYIAHTSNCGLKFLDFGGGVIVYPNSYNAYSSPNTVWRSTDYGATWSTVSMGAHVGTTGNSGSIGWKNGVGMFWNRYQMLRTDDYGLTWVENDEIIPRYLIDFGNGSLMIFTAYSTYGYRRYTSNDYGATWTLVGNDTGLDMPDTYSVPIGAPVFIPK